MYVYIILQQSRHEHRRQRLTYYSNSISAKVLKD